jgi:hypothetical protein
MNELTKMELEELESLLFSLVNAHTKAAGKEIRKKLDFKASIYHDRLDPHVRQKLKEAISHAGEASGQGKQKEHWEFHFQQCWQVFKSNLVKSENSK